MQFAKMQSYGGACPKHLRRNDTGYPLAVTAELSRLYEKYLQSAGTGANAGADADEKAWVRQLKYYQYLVKNVMSDPRYGVGDEGNGRGLLVYATMGMGKTRLAVAVAMAVWDVRHPVILLPRSLQKNFKDTVREVVAGLHMFDAEVGLPPISPEALTREQNAAVAKFAFISMDAYNAADQLARISADTEFGKVTKVAKVTKVTKVAKAEVSKVSKPVKSEVPEAEVPEKAEVPEAEVSEKAEVPEKAKEGGGIGGLDDAILIVDEAHNLFRAIINSSADTANARRIYDMVMSARNLRLVFLTGTPAAKDPFELVPCFNMLAGFDLLPTQFEVFYSMYVDRERHAVKNRDRLANRLVGLISHVSHGRPSVPAGSAAGATLQPGDNGWFPVERPTIIEIVEMARDQYRLYNLAREQEIAEASGSEAGVGRVAAVTTTPLSLPGVEKRAMSSYYVKSRMLSIFAPPTEYRKIPVHKLGLELFTSETAPKLALIAQHAVAAAGPVLVYSQFVEQSLKVLCRFLDKEKFVPFIAEDFQALFVNGGDSGGGSGDSGGSNDTAINTAVTHPASFGNINTNTKVDTFGNAELCRYCRRETCMKTRPGACGGGSGGSGGSGSDGSGASSGALRTYAIISGEVSSEHRAAIVQAFNSPANMHGAVIKVILVSKTGAEGLDLKWIRETHQVEPYWDRARDDQVRARAVRLGSHDGLPVAERVVQPYLYVATANVHVRDLMPERARETQTTDEMFHERAHDKYMTNLAFRTLLAETSLECSLFGYGNCRECLPTGTPLFHNDPALDLRLPDPCIPPVATEVAAEPFQFEGTTFYAAPDAEGVRMYVYQDDVGAYTEVAYGDPRRLGAESAWAALAPPA